jgi:hypothetical protein
MVFVRFDSISNTVNKQRKICVGARVDAGLAEAVQRLADAGNRSLSREVAEAIRRHVLLSEFPASAVGPRSQRAVDQPQHAGSER